MMNFEVLLNKKDEGKLLLKISGVEIAYVNALRRIIIDEVPTLAIEDVEIIKNSSALFDEMIGHRLGLIPLKTDQSYIKPSECACNGEGCGKCQVKFKLNTRAEGIVDASKLKTTDPNVVPVFEHMPIVKLMPNQQLQLEASAIMGCGKEHAKWSPAHVHYQKEPVLSIDEKKVDNPEQFIKKCPIPVLVLKGNKIQVKQDALLEYMGKIDCLEDFSEAIKVERTEDFIFSIESYGQLTPKQILVSAVNILDKKLDNFNDAVSSLNV